MVNIFHFQPSKHSFYVGYFAQKQHNTTVYLKEKKNQIYIQAVPSELLNSPHSVLTEAGFFFFFPRAALAHPLSDTQWRLCAGARAKLQVVTGSDGSLTLRAAVFIRVYSALCLAKINRVPGLLEGKSADSEHTFVQVVSRKCH